MQDIISRCWHADPAERPSAREVVQLLNDAAPAIGSLESACKRGVVPLPNKAAGADGGGGGGGGGCCVIC